MTAARPIVQRAVQGPLTIYEAAEAKPLLLQWVAELAAAGTRELAVDLREVPELDTAGVQLLLLLRREALARGVALRVSAVSEAVGEVLALLALQAHLGLAATGSAAAGVPLAVGEAA